MDTVLKNIRTDLRLSMDGATAASMRQLGVNFRMNFGVSISRIKEISLKYELGPALAERLWGEDVRELKILATMLFPRDEMLAEMADEWGRSITNQEIREQACKNLFQELPFADKLVEKWSVHADESARTTGYWLFTRLCIVHPEVVGRVESEAVLKRAINDLGEESLLLCQSALNALRFFGRRSKENATWVLHEVSHMESSMVSREREMFDQLRYEFEEVISQPE